MMGYYHYGYGLGALGFLWMIVWWAIIIAAIVMIVRLLAGQSSMHHSGKGRHSALDILKERYAKGEIDKKEFDERKKGLMD